MYIDREWTPNPAPLSVAAPKQSGSTAYIVAIVCIVGTVFVWAVIGAAQRGWLPVIEQSSAGG